MRYLNVETISFVGADGITRATKGLREIPDYSIRKIVSRQAMEPPDYTSARGDVFGSRQEQNAYLLWEANHVPILEYGFDIAQMNTFKVPVARPS